MVFVGIAGVCWRMVKFAVGRWCLMGAFTLWCLMNDDAPSRIMVFSAELWCLVEIYVLCYRVLMFGGDLWCTVDDDEACLSVSGFGEKR